MIELNLLPYELLEEIFSYLPSRDLVYLYQALLTLPGIDPFVFSSLAQFLKIRSDLQIQSESDEQVMDTLFEIGHFDHLIINSCVFSMLLCVSARAGHLESVKVILGKEIDLCPDIMNNAGFGGSLPVVNQIIDACMKNFPRMFRSKSGRAYTEKQLMKKGICFWDDGMHGAAEKGHLHIVERMIEMGADDWSGAISQASMYGHLEIVNRIAKEGKRTLDREDYIRLLNDGMRSAVYGGCLQIVQIFCRKGATNLNIAKTLAKKYGHLHIQEFFETRLLPRK